MPPIALCEVGFALSLNAVCLVALSQMIASISGADLRQRRATRDSLDMEAEAALVASIAAEAIEVIKPS